MATHKEKQSKEIFIKFKKQKVLTMINLTSILICSERTVQRRLKDWGAYTSYNKNGGYYTILDIPQFNKYGIWKHKDIYFSKFGNLKNTVINVVKNSEAGLSAKELSNITGMSSYTFLSHFKNDDNIHREKHKGIYIYFSCEPFKLKLQRHERETIIHSTATHDLPTDTESIIILVELIKKPKANIDQLARSVRRNGTPISNEKIFNLLTYHGILKKTQLALPT
jgi:transcriptional antiterminator